MTKHRFMLSSLLFLFLCSPQQASVASELQGKVVEVVDGETVVVSYANGTYQGTTTTTRMSPNVYAQERAAENNQRRSSEAAGRADQVQGTALKINTLFPGEQTAGLIYFEKKKFVETGAFQILIDGTVYQFLFTPVAKK